MDWKNKKEEKMTDITFQAMKFAMEAHKDHKRKYTNNPYFTHLAEVAGLIATVRKDAGSISIAWLHDVIEDCGVTHEKLFKNFGKVIADGVLELSDLEDGNRSMRKRLSRERLGRAHNRIQDIKVCDLISNTSSIVHHDPKFSKTYLQEKRLLLEVLTKADPRLIKIAFEQINKENEND